MLTQNDFDTLTLPEDDLLLGIADITALETAESVAYFEINGYLTGKYNVEAIFAAVDPDRNPDIIVHTMGIVMYRLYFAVLTYCPAYWQTKYNEARAWLTDVARGIIEPDLPLLVDPVLRFLKDNDYDTLILDEDKELITQSTLINRYSAEDMAIDQMGGYLRGKYDVVLAFPTAIDAIRSKVLVMYCMDITLYHLHASIPGRFVPEIRRIRYEDALAWLKDVAKGLTVPDLPLKTDPVTGDAITGPAFVFGGNAKQDNSW